MSVALDGAVDSRSGDAEEVAKLGNVVLAAAVQSDEMRFLARVELGLLATQTSLDVGRLRSGEIDRHYGFGVLAISREPPHDSILVTGRTPSDPSRIIIALSRISIDAVAEMHTVTR